ncbi:LysR family transcriptional regulator [Streptomyces sp. NPDC048603]|uniref:LysR family transcriptional regulator n=1 Tax=Streptomyces sp. NPDC048603 TaxID=3365577 RepID=UPI0037160EC5
MLTDRDELECFLILAEELHFGRTAERMLLSRARVSQLTGRLERRVGAPLFRRTSRRVSLTALGRQLREDLEPHHRGIREALERAAATARAVGGELHVGFPTPTSGELVLRAAGALRATHPDLVVTVCEVPLSDPYGQLRSGGFDAAFAEFPVREPDLEAGPVLLTERRVLAVAADDPLAARTELTLEDLAGVRLLPTGGDVPAHLRERSAPDRTPGGRPISRGPEVVHVQEALMLVAAGEGALLAPEHMAAYHARPGVAYLPVAGAEPIGYGLVWRAADDSGAVRALARAAADVAAGAVPEARGRHHIRNSVRNPVRNVSS